jgi:hypothetical protein
MIKCEHCDVDAYYRLTIEDFNIAEVYSADLCIKCIKIEASKAIDNFPTIKSLKIEPLFNGLYPYYVAIIVGKLQLLEPIYEDYLILL